LLVHIHYICVKYSSIHDILRSETETGQRRCSLRIDARGEPCMHATAVPTTVCALSASHGVVPRRRSAAARNDELSNRTGLGPTGTCTCTRLDEARKEGWNENDTSTSVYTGQRSEKTKSNPISSILLEPPAAESLWPSTV
jgi:hypothetical protein